jgi:hypothetical protein
MGVRPGGADSAGNWPVYTKQVIAPDGRLTFFGIDFASRAEQAKYLLEGVAAGPTEQA